MVIIGVSGGLGNQMFQYALYRKLLTLGKKAKLDLSYFSAPNRIRDFELDIFNVKFEMAKSNEIIRMGVNDYTFWGNIISRSKLIPPQIYVENLETGYQPQIFDMHNIYLSGYWQSEKYFYDIRTELLEIYQFPVIMDNQCAAILDKINETESVSIHIRRKDYLDEHNNKIYGGICTPDYYQKAISYFRKNHNNARFYIFSDDPEWVKANFVDEDMQIIDCSMNNISAFDMSLMSRCKHNIIANSSFSWWAAWLNQNINKEIIAPYKWCNNYNINHIICDSWIRIEGNLT